MQINHELKNKIITALMITLTIILALTPFGMIRLPLVSVTIAHIPILITTILFGLSAGLWVATSFGIISLILAIMTPTSILDPYFVNPLISVLPRLLIPVTTYVTYRGTCFLRNYSLKDCGFFPVALAALVGNLTNTFGVYTMLYLIYAQDILAQTGKSALTLIIAAISTSTVLKSVVVLIVVVPLVRILKKALKM